MLGKADFLVGPELPDYIERKFRNELVQRGFVPADALDPTKSANRHNYKTLVVTLQSVAFGEHVGFLSTQAKASVCIGVQEYAPSSSREIYAGSFSGTSEGRLGWSVTGVSAGHIIAVAADHAVDTAFADAAFEQALK